MFENISNKFANTFKAKKRIWLIIPFVLFMLIMFIVPMIIILVAAFLPVSSNGIAGNPTDNFDIVDGYVWQKIFKSGWIALASTAICFLIGFPFAYFLSRIQNKVYKVSVILFATAPIWSSVLVKLIGLKSLFDLIASANNNTITINSTHGDIFTIIGICYVYIPFLILPLYTVLDSMPKNYVLASQDLGYNAFSSFFFVVIPYCKAAIISSLILVLLPAFTTVAIPQFLNNSNDSTMIGDYIFNLGANGLESNLAIAQASGVSLILGVFILSVFALWKGIPKIVQLIKRKISTGSFVGPKKDKKIRINPIMSKGIN